MRIYVVPAAKRVGTDLLKFAMPKMAEFVGGRKIEKVSRQLQKKWEDKLWENNWVVVGTKIAQAESFQHSLQNKPVGFEEAFF